MLLASLVFLALSPSAHADPCRFASGQFTGTPAEQARCLLRKVLPGGIVGAPLPLPAFLVNAVGKPVTVPKEKLAAYLEARHVGSAEVGGSVAAPVSSNGSARALYFVIHDTSDETGNGFPPNMNEASWGPNHLDDRDLSVAHVFVNRLGQSATGNEYGRATGATKREKREAGLKGLMLHHELVQPRIRGGGFDFGALGPNPGFTPKQLQRLALLYVVASVRRGIWMIPAFHCVIDTGIFNGHDDPQNFDLESWSKLVESVIAEIQAS